MSDPRGWIDAGFGASGDMLLAAFIDVGADLAFIKASVDAVAPEPIEIRTERVERGGIAAMRVHVGVSESGTERHLSDIRGLLAAASLDDTVRAHALAVFSMLAEAEGRVHGTSPDAVHFHEVGALDSIADIVGVCAAMVSLGLFERLTCSPVAVGSGTVKTAHGTLSVPPPAVAELLRGSATHAGPAQSELCTPTGAALINHIAGAAGDPQPPMIVSAIGVGAGSRNFTTHPNVLRLFVGEAAYAAAQPELGPFVVEANIDDFDARLWPNVLARLFEAGASDAWLTPILMKKGRPAYTLSALVSSTNESTVTQAIFLETSTIGVRRYSVEKRVLEREMRAVTVHGMDIRVKVARMAGTVVNVQPEYEDVARVAEMCDEPVKEVMASAIAAAQNFWEGD